MAKRLPTEEKIKIIKRVKAGESVSKVCSEAKIARKTFYGWKKRYGQASRRNKRRSLAPRYLSGKTHPRNRREQFENQVLSVIVSSPSYGSKRISIILGKYGFSLSNHTVYRLLKDLNLETQPKREEFSGLYQTFAKVKTVYDPKPWRLTPEARKRIIEEVVLGKKKVTEVCRQYRLSRKTFYKWLAKYKEAQQKEVVLLVSLEDNYLKGLTHPRIISQEIQEKILSLVRQNPEYSTHKVAQRLVEVGNHGVQNVFKRLDLNTYEKRLAYVESSQPVIVPTRGVLGRLRTLIGQIPAISAIPPPTREKLASLTPPFLVSLFSSTLLFSGLFYWFSLMAQIPGIGGKLGLFFATLALGVGGFFFTYSMKYYLTLALVLSFSRQPLEEGGYSFGMSAKLNNQKKNGLNGNGNGGLKGWVGKVFGLTNENGNRKRNGLHRIADIRNGNNLGTTGGLQPSLDHIKLKRKPFVSVHLPMYNEKRVAERLIKACASMDYYQDGKACFEVLVCDDSTDETIEIVQRVAKNWNKNHEFGPKVRVLHRPTRKGFKGAALGYALQKVNPKTEFIVVFDADFVPYPDTLKLFAKYFKSNQVLAGKKDALDKNSKIAAVTGYQWHVLNKSENWITRGVRTEYAGSYVIERPGREILGLVKQIHGTVYMIRRDVLQEVGWGTSITEDFQLTLKLYEAGYKVIYTPYVQAPAECVSTLKRLIRQRMRWAEGHSNCIKKKAIPLILSPKLTIMEKLEVLYLIPYYLQAFFFLIGTFAWLVSEAVFKVKLPFWTSLWGWSLVLTNFFALPLMNAVGLFLEESEERDYVGILSFILLCYIVVPFQAYASIKGFIEKEEGPWFRTPKTGKITDIFRRGSFYRWISGIIPGRSTVAASLRAPQIAPAYRPSQYLNQATANNRFNQFKIKPKRNRLIGNLVLMIVLVSSFAFSYLGGNIKTGLLSDLPIQTRVERIGEDVSFLSQASKIFSPKEVLAVTEKAQGMVVSGVKQVPAETLIASLLLILLITVFLLIRLYRKKKKNFKKAVKFIFAFCLILSWLLSGWPVIWKNPRFPPKIKVAQAAIPSLISAGAIAGDGGPGAGSIAPTMPAHVANDILMVSAYNAGGDTMSTSTSGWAEITEVDGTDNMSWYWKRATGSGTDGPTVESASTDIFVIGYVIRGCATTVTPYEDATTANSASSRTATSATALITTEGADRLVASFNNRDDNTTWSSGYPPSTWTDADNQVSDIGTDVHFTVITKEKASAGDESAVTIGTSGQSEFWGSLTLAFIPNQPPTVALNTPTDTGTISDTTPTFDFTGTDADSDEIRYNIQVDDASDFDIIEVDQIAPAAETGTTASLDVTFSSTPTAGSLVAVGVAQWDANANIGIDSVTDNQANSYSLAVSDSWEYTAGQTILSAIYYAENVSTSGTFTVTVTFTTSGCDSAAGAVSYTGVATSSSLDGTNSNQGTGTAADSGSITPSAGDAVYFGSLVYANSSTTSDADSPWSEEFSIDNCSYSPINGADQITSGAQTAEWTIGTSASWMGAIAGFKAAGSVLINEVSGSDPGIDLTLEYTSVAGAARTNTTMDRPTNTADDDFLLAHLYIESDSITVTEPSGWNLIADTTASDNSFRSIIYYKRASSEPSSWTWTHADTGSGFTAGFVKRFTGVVASGDPEDATRSTDSSSGSTPSWTSITTSTDGAALIGVEGHYATASRRSNSTLTERIDEDDVFLQADIDVTAGSTGALVATDSSSDDWVTTFIALKPAAVTDGFVNPDTAGDRDPFNSGENIQYTVQAGDTLSPGTYYWRVRGLDPSGSNTYGAWSSTYSFTILSFEQSAYRWFENDNSTSVGDPIVDQDTLMTSGETPAQGTAFRLRVLIHIGNGTLASSGQNLKLQIATKVGESCDTDMATTDESYADLVTTTGTIRYYNNTTPADDAALTEDVTNDPDHSSHTTVTQTYKDLDGSDSNINFTNSQGQITTGQDGEWDFAMVDNSASEDTTYCLRIVKADDTVLDTYSVIPEFTTVPENPFLLFGLLPLVTGFLTKLRRRRKK